VTPSPEEVRRRLRELGYLESPLARFISRGRLRGALATSVATGVRVGVVFGTLLAGFFLAGFLLLDRSLLERPGDAARLAGVLLGLGLVAGAAGGTLLGFVFAGLGALRGRGLPDTIELTARKGAAVAGAVVAAYLGFSWWRLRGSFGEVGLLVDLAGAVGAMLGGAVAAGSVRAATVYLLARREGLRALSARDRRRGRLGLGAIGVVGALALLVAFRAGAQAAPASATPFEWKDTGRSVLVLGFDGVDPALLEARLTDGPSLAGLRARSARYSIDVSAYRSPAAFWTAATAGIPRAGARAASPATMAPRGFEGGLSVDPSAVGFYEVVHVVLPALGLARMRPATATSLDRPRVFEILGERGLPVGVVNVWLTYPAPALPGFVVSERAFWKTPSRARDGSEMHPPEAFAEFLERVAPADEKDPAARAEALDAAVENALASLSARFRPRFAMGEFWGTDTMLLAMLREPSGAAGDLALARALEESLGRLDRRVGRLLEGASFRDSVVFLVGFPGFASRPESGKRYAGDRASLWIAGEGVAPGDRGEASASDLAPTLLALFGLPTSREMPGRALVEAFEPGALEARPPIDSYGRRPRERIASEREADETTLSIYRQLGYLSAPR